MVLTDDGVAFTKCLHLVGTMRFPLTRVCDEHDIEHRPTKPYHSRTHGRAERMNRTVKDACHQSLPLRTH